MTHRFPIKDLAAQAGLSTATVDRVLNRRAHVSARTHARVAAAMAELEAQEAQLVARGRTVWIDVVVEAPARFSREIKAAAEAVLPLLRPAVVRARFTMAEVTEVPEMVRRLDRIGRRGSQGVLLKARDVAAVRDAVKRLRDKGIPVVTLVTDIAGSTGYAGLDNAQAGRVAADLIARHVQRGIVLTSASREDFAGEAARLRAFSAAIGLHAPGLRIVALADGAGQNAATAAGLAQVAQADVVAVYSVGGGNRAICGALPRGAAPVFVAHDLDADNLRLLAAGALSYVLYHDLRADIEEAFRRVLAHLRLVPAPPDQGGSDVQIILRDNVPKRFLTGL